MGISATLEGDSPIVIGIPSIFMEQCKISQEFVVFSAILGAVRFGRFPPFLEILGIFMDFRQVPLRHILESCQIS